METASLLSGEDWIGDVTFPPILWLLGGTKTQSDGQMLELTCVNLAYVDSDLLAGSALVPFSSKGSRSFSSAALC